MYTRVDGRHINFPSRQHSARLRPDMQGGADFGARGGLVEVGDLVILYAKSYGSS